MTIKDKKAVAVRENPRAYFPSTAPMMDVSRGNPRAYFPSTAPTMDVSGVAHCLVLDGACNSSTYILYCLPSSVNLCLVYVRLS